MQRVDRNRVEDDVGASSRLEGFVSKVFELLEDNGIQAYMKIDIE